MHNTTLHENLDRLMSEQGWTARGLSGAIGRHRNTVYNILNSKNKNTNFEVIEDIAKILGTTPFHLLGYGVGSVEGSAGGDGRGESIC